MSRAHYVHLRGYVNRLWIPFFGETNIREIRGKDIKAFYYSLTQGPKAVYNAMAALHKLFTDAFDEEIIQTIPKFPPELKASNIPEPAWKWASEEIQDNIFEHLEPEDLYFILFQCSHGTRTGETRALQHGDIDLENERVTIARAFSGQDLRHTKSKRIRKIPLDPVWKEIYLSRPTSITPSAFVFLKDGKPFSESWARKKWNEAREKAGVGHLTLYAGSRQSLASQAANRGASIYAIAKFLGHSNLKVTERYAHLNTDPLLQVQRKATVTPFKKKSTQ
jgi:integrase